MNNKYGYIIALLTISTTCFANSDVVERFEAITDKFTANMVNIPASMSPPSDDTDHKWYKRQAHIRNVGYDVRKTDSLVSPFIGEITYQCNVTGRSGASKQEASKGPDSFNTTGDFCTAKYAFQKNKWIKKNVICKDDSGGLREPMGVMVDCASALPLSD